MTRHIPVLLDEAIEAMDLQKGDTVVDATLGGGGHTRAILSHVLPGGRVVAFDADERAVGRFLRSAEADAFLRKAMEKGSLSVVGENFSRITETLRSLGIGKVDSIFADFGFSSDQMNDPERGFSFRADGPLDMRLDGRTEHTAADIVNGWDDEALAKLFRDYGDEPKAWKIAKAIVARRAVKPFSRTVELAETVSGCFSDVERKKKYIHPATKVFQSIRMEVNGELSVIETLLRNGVELLSKGGRIVVITFHSGEDSLVKSVFADLSKGCVCPAGFPKCVCGQQAQVKTFSPKFIVPSEQEVAGNPRSRSAKLRVVEKL
ncbi:MAG: 16S rRNA (cytosine(1402)-N(4))-methyltransferase RsmH [Candidatus Moranbacteria bacterium]|nr:16S rRNA (cytosine(1402)-N(4))-methyltransferase RsmH [Candidatus Moranbacteria bacterium]NTW75947.1 16S rRNA (cytosine(1402)-N(4))-methyltransferase RsmH [Candidatus Moranbacteria bacterium]